MFGRPASRPRPRQYILGPTDSRAPLRRRRHGMSIVEQDLMRAAQDGRCAICGHRTARLQLDHDHRHCPGPEGCRQCVRGLLCSKCNSGLGLIGDRNIDGLLRYLMK